MVSNSVEYTKNNFGIHCVWVTKLRRVLIVIAPKRHSLDVETALGRTQTTSVFKFDSPIFAGSVFMTTRAAGKTISAVISLILTVTPSSGYANEESGPGGAADSAPMNAHELNSLVAPIALYPDPLVAQVLSAST